jgi:hypothetical protein
MTGRGKEGLEFYPTITMRIKREGRWVFPGPELSFFSSLSLGNFGVRFRFVLDGRLMTCLEGALVSCS